VQASSPVEIIPVTAAICFGAKWARFDKNQRIIANVSRRTAMKRPHPKYKFQ